MNIAEISTEDLRELLKKIPEELKDRDAKERSKVLSELQALAKSRGYSMDDLVGSPSASSGAKRARASSGPVAPKYANPEDASVTWTGRGRKPGWVEAHLAAGKALEDILITPR